MMIIHNNQRPLLHLAYYLEIWPLLTSPMAVFINVSFGSRNFVCLITFSLFSPLAGWPMMLNDKHLCLALF